MTSTTETASDETSTCPACLGVPRREGMEAEADEVTFVITLCDVCEQTGRVSRRLARALWGHQEPSA